VFAAACVLIIVAVSRWETIPFHLIWVSLTLLYGFRVWRNSTTAAVLGVVVATTGLALAWTVVEGNRAIDEVSEVPLMASMFVVMAWHAQRRQRAVDAAELAVASERRVHDRQREFVRDASHELRTPITVARGHAELIRSGSDDHQTVQDAQVILDELDRLARLSDRLLVLAAADQPNFLVEHKLWVRGFVEDRIHRWKPAARRDWRASVETDGSVLADRDRLAAAVDALVENAVHATGEGDTIQIAARADGATLVLEISDAGSGIDPELVPHLFVRFWRREPDRARGSGGTGLGLAIVKAIAEAHGGKVEVAARPDHGAVFRLCLPHFVPSAQPADEAARVVEIPPLSAGALGAVASRRPREGLVAPVEDRARP
jgi:signal transduction histidine kinase